MKKLAVRYAIVRFQPHVETEEFANIGIVLVAPDIGYLDFKLETRRFSRLTGFFDSLEPSIIRSALKNYSAELKRVKEFSRHNGEGQTRFEFERSDNAEHLFVSLTKNREGIIQFSEVRFAMTDNPKGKLEDLFDYYVGRNFVSPQYREGILESKVRNMLKADNLSQKFKRVSFDDGVYSATFPFVKMVDNSPTRIIKPIFLGQEEATRLIDHGNKWLFTINRLKRFLPRDVIFAVEGPSREVTQQRAFKETVEQFEANNIQVVDATNERELMSAAN